MALALAAVLCGSGCAGAHGASPNSLKVVRRAFASQGLRASYVFDASKATVASIEIPLARAYRTLSQRQLAVVNSDGLELMREQDTSELFLAGRNIWLFVCLSPASATRELALVRRSLAGGAAEATKYERENGFKGQPVRPLPVRQVGNVLVVSSPSTLSATTRQRIRRAIDSLSH
jgi:hypothetical protein